MVCKGARDVPEVKGMCSRFFLFSTLVYSIQHSVDELFQNGMDYFSMVMCVIFFGYMYEVKGFGVRAHTHNTHTHTRTHAQPNHVLVARVCVCL